MEPTSFCHILLSHAVRSEDSRRASRFHSLMRGWQSHIAEEHVGWEVLQLSLKRGKNFCHGIFSFSFLPRICKYLWSSAEGCKWNCGLSFPALPVLGPERKGNLIPVERARSVKNFLFLGKAEILNIYLFKYLTRATMYI